MESFIETFSFVLIPCLTALLFSIVTPPVGALLSLRNETFLGITMPALGNAVIALTLLCGISLESTFLLYGITCLSLFLVMVFLPLGLNKVIGGSRKREQLLGIIFCVGNMVMILIMALSPDVDNHFKTVLQGEILAIMEWDFYITALMMTIILAIGVRFRGYFYSLTIDEEFLFIREESYKKITLTFRAVVAVIITGGLILMGPLFTAALLIIPVSFLESHGKNLDRFMILLVGISLLSTTLGFMMAVWFDVPPVSIIVLTMVIIIGIFRFFCSILRRCP